MAGGAPGLTFDQRGGELERIGEQALDLRRDLLDDVRYQIDHVTYPPDEIATRFHHRLVAIHPFPNGNGRHARMMADLMIQKLGQPRFTWGSKSLTEATETRISYIDSLRAADSGNIQPLLAFVRS